MYIYAYKGQGVLDIGGNSIRNEINFDVYNCSFQIRVIISECSTGPYSLKIEVNESGIL